MTRKPSSTREKARSQTKCVKVNHFHFVLNHDPGYWSYNIGEMIERYFFSKVGQTKLFNFIKIEQHLIKMIIL